MKRFSFGLLALTLLMAAGCDSGGSPINEQNDLLSSIMGSVPFNTLSSGQLGTQEDADAFFARQIFVHSMHRVDASSTSYQPFTDLHLQVYEGDFVIPRDNDLTQHEVHMQIANDVIRPGVYQASTLFTNPSRLTREFDVIYQVRTNQEEVHFLVTSGTVTITAVQDDWMEGTFSLISDQAQVIDLTPFTTVTHEFPARRDTLVFDDPITLESAFRVERRLSRLDDGSSFEATGNGMAIMGAAKVIGTHGIMNPTPYAEDLWTDSLASAINLRGYPEMYAPHFPQIMISYFGDATQVLGPAPGTYEARTIFTEDTDKTTLPVFMPRYTVVDEATGNLIAYTASSGTVVIQERTEDWLKGTFEFHFDGKITLPRAEITEGLSSQWSKLTPRAPEPLNDPLIITGHFAADSRTNGVN